MLTCAEIENLVKSYNYSANIRTLESMYGSELEKSANFLEKSRQEFPRKLMINLLDYTYLEDDISSADMVNIVSSITRPVPVAGLCVKPINVPKAYAALSETKSAVKLVSVAGGFPTSMRSSAAMLSDIEAVLKNNSDEVDVVLDTYNFNQGNYAICAEKIRASSHLCQMFNTKLKIILEISELGSSVEAMKASLLAILAGADFIKTSTGYTSRGADYYSVAVMCSVIKYWYEKTGIKTGIKPSGGVDSVTKYETYLSIIQSILGDSWLQPDLTRVGASKIFLQLHGAKKSKLTNGSAQIKY